MTYWQRRLQNPLHKAYNENEQATRQWLSVYQQASKDIKAEIFDTYQKMNIEKPLISDFYRYNNLQKIEKQINDSILQLGTKEVDYTKQSLQHATLVGSQAAADVLNTNVLNKSAIDELIKRPWHDANFSDRIWKNKAQLINSLKSELTNGIIQGKSIYEVANTIDGRLDVGRSQTQRLVRTEYMHALNQGQIESYRAKGYTKLKWIATMDYKTSKICRKLNRKEFDIENLPDIPAHPNCRCTMVPVIDMAAAEKRGDEIRRLKDKISGKTDVNSLDKVYNDSVREMFPREFRHQNLTRDILIKKLKDDFKMDIVETSRTRLSDIALNQVHNILDNFKVLYNALPQKIPKIEAISASKAKDAIAFYSRTAASSTPVKFGINVKFFKTPDSLQEVVDRSIKSGWFSKNGDINHVMIHEFGHHVDFQLSKMMGGNFSDRVFSNMVNNYGDKYDLRNLSNNIGGYANSYYRKFGKQTESFAELFAEAYGNTPREIAVDFRTEFEKIAKELINNASIT